MIKLKKLLREYQLADQLALVKMMNKLNFWQENAVQLDSQKQVHAELVPLLRDFGVFYWFANDIVEQCINKQVFDKHKVEQIQQQLQQLRDQQKEVVFAIIPIFQQLLTSCQTQHQQTQA